MNLYLEVLNEVKQANRQKVAEIHEKKSEKFYNPATELRQYAEPRPYSRSDFDKRFAVTNLIGKDIER